MYSALFSSGLLAPRVARRTTPSPVAISACPIDPGVDRHWVPPAQTTARPKALEACTNAERPRVRRRRSSVNVATRPMALIKSPARNAGAALQRAGFMSPTRHRAASVGVNRAGSEDNSLLGRLRSGSVGGTTHPPKRLRRAIRVPFPLVPPPNAPLPAPPPSPTAGCGSSLSPAVILGPIPRQPFTTRRCTDVCPSKLLSPGYVSDRPIQVPQGLFGSCDPTFGEAMMEN